MLNKTKVSDPLLYEIVGKELERQKHNIEMIASESTVPVEIMELSGCIFTNKTLEGYPGKRFQAGSHVADELEILANKRGMELYGCDHINIQPYSGSTANYAVYAAILKKDDKVMSMKLDQGGHLSHGSKANFMSRFFNFEHYAIDKDTEQIDYDGLEKQAKEFRPKLIIAGGSAYPRLIDFERIAKIAKEVDAYFMVDMAHISGLVAAEVVPSPVPYADFVTSSTTKTLGGPRAGFVMCKKEYADKLDKGVFPGSLGSMHLTTMAAKCWLFEYAKSEKFRSIMRQIPVNAKHLAKELENYGFRIVSGGTDTHIVLVDVRNKNITGKEFDDALDYVGITVNKNQIPFDPEGPNVTSGVRIGLTSVTQRGLREKEISEIASIMNEVAENVNNKEKLDELRERADKLIEDFPLYSDEDLKEIM
ncbi:serine hydroxymethyltransferase [Peptoniphilus sp.]|jgi:glycine hydroxymethyltransferase|uniref:serine hydroxymethyltransferase n=1 Tax=Peptoniphilus sp. TaxID=1971214 RepID=UPI003D8ADDC5